MSLPCKFERSLLSHEEYETIRLTHHPAIYNVEAAELEAMRPRLRKMRDRERTLNRQRRRERSRGSWSKLSRNRRACIRTQAGLHRGAEAAE
jgi:hypothetical protein